jgi:hypothetical protein
MPTRTRLTNTVFTVLASHRINGGDGSYLPGA